MAADPDGVSSGGRVGTHRDNHLLPLPRAGEPTATPRVSRGGSSEREAVKMPAHPDGVFTGGSGGMRHADDHLPIPRAGEPASSSRVSRGSSSRRSEASEGAARYADAEGMGKQVVSAAVALGGRGAHYSGRSSPSYGSHHSAVLPLNSRKTHRYDDASSSVAIGLGCSKHCSSVITKNKLDGVPVRKCLTISAKGSIQTSDGIAIATTLGGGGGYGDPHPPPFYKGKVSCKRTAIYWLKCCHLVVCDHAEDAEGKQFLKHKEQERLSTRTNLMKMPSIQRIIRSQAARHASPVHSGAEMGNQVPSGFSNRQHKYVGAVCGSSASRIIEKENEVDGQKYRQRDRLPSHILSGCALNSESDGAFEGNNHKQACDLPQNIKLQDHMHPSLLRIAED